MLGTSTGSTWQRRSQAGIVGLNLVIVLAFALYAVIQLSRVTLAAKRIDDTVEVIIAEVGPGSNVSRLDETQILDNVGSSAEQILERVKPLEGQANTVISTAQSIDRTVSGILTNAQEINGTVRTINSQAAALRPVVDEINQGVADINGRAARATPVVGGISDDLGQVNTQVVLIDGHAKAICSVGLVPTVQAPGCT